MVIHHGRKMKIVQKGEVVEETLCQVGRGFGVGGSGGILIRCCAVERLI